MSSACSLYYIFRIQYYKQVDMIDRESGRRDQSDKGQASRPMVRISQGLLSWSWFLWVGG